MGAVKAILEEVGPRSDDDDEPRERSNSKLKLLKDTVGAIREKKYVKGRSFLSLLGVKRVERRDR